MKTAEEIIQEVEHDIHFYGAGRKHLIDAINEELKLKNPVSISDEDIEKPQPCFYEPDNTTSMNCKNCGRPQYLHNQNIYNPHKSRCKIHS